MEDSKIQKVDRPVVRKYDDKTRIVKSGSHYIFNHAYELKSKDNKVIYKHIILTQDLSHYDSNEPVRRVDTDIKLYSANKLMEEKPYWKDCFKSIFDSQIIFFKCSQDTLIDIRDYVLDNGCVGLIDIVGNILLYSEKNNTISITGQIQYNSTDSGGFFTKFMNRDL